MDHPRHTKQRDAILRALTERSNHHFNTDELFAYLRECGTEIGIATIYRNLHLLEEEGLLVRLSAGTESAVRYQFMGESIPLHAHLICRSCGRILDQTIPLLSQLERELTATCGFAIADRQLTFYGTCKDCKKH